MIKLNEQQLTTFKTQGIEILNYQDYNEQQLKNNNIVCCLNIINNKDIRLTENMTSENDLIDIKIKNTLNELNNSESYNKNFKNIEQSETSISHNPNIKFQEIFSNNENKNKSLNNNNENKNKSLNNENKTKFFNNYLKI